jgi:ribose transport system ATP-binding protein
MEAALHVANLSKTFGGSRVLRNVEITIGRGEIHGVLGQNGCGKSTFVKLLAGFHHPDPGSRAELFGRTISLPLAPDESRRSGLSFVHQNLGLVPSLSVLENLRIAELTAPRRWHIDWRGERRAAAEVFARIGVDIDPMARIADLSAVDRALVAIARALESIRAAREHAGVPGLLVLDEPTPFLPHASVQKLFTLLRRIVAGGASVILISHDIDEILEVTDRATVLRDGEVAGHFVTADSGRDAIIEQIIGRRLAAAETPFRPPSTAGAGVTVAALRGASGHEISFAVDAGEIVGVTGLAGAGFDRVLHHLFGSIRAAGGTLRIGARQIDLSRLTPGAAIDHGIALLPSDRLGAGGVGALPLLDNLCIGTLSTFVRRGALRRSRMLAHARRLAAEFDVRPPAPAKPLSQFSGGNAQKAMLAKWLDRKPKLLLLEEPTQGVDVGARRQLWAAIRRAADDGASVLCGSSDHGELASLCDRVLMFRQGRIIAELGRGELTKELIAARCYG